MPMCKGIELGDICGDIGDVYCFFSLTKYSAP
jgi:hypothetical protein